MFSTPINLVSDSATRALAMTSRDFLSRDRLRQHAPSVFADSAYHAMSDRYRFVPTIEVVDVLADAGYLPVRADQSRSRIPGKADFTRHMLRFRHESDLARTREVGNEFTELVMVNSHDGTSAYEFSIGVFRLVCLNGMIRPVPGQDARKSKIYHKGDDRFAERVIDVTYEVMSGQSSLAAEIETFNQLSLTAGEQLAFATASAELREANVKPVDLLRARRRADAMESDGTRDLWKTFNTVQENTLKGGIPSIGSTGKRIKTRAVTSVDADVKTNKALWILAQEMAKLKS